MARSATSRPARKQACGGKASFLKGTVRSRTETKIILACGAGKCRQKWEGGRKEVCRRVYWGCRREWGMAPIRAPDQDCSQRSVCSLFMARRMLCMHASLHWPGAWPLPRPRAPPPPPPHPAAALACLSASQLQHIALSQPHTLRQAVPRRDSPPIQQTLTRTHKPSQTHKHSQTHSPLA